MPTPGEHKTVQASILEYAGAIGWIFVPREEAEQRRGFDPAVPPRDRARAVQENFENRQTSTAEALAALLKEVEGNEARKKDQAEATPGACQELEILARNCPAVGEEFAVVKNQR